MAPRSRLDFGQASSLRDLSRPLWAHDWSRCSTGQAWAKLDNRQGAGSRSTRNCRIENSQRIEEERSESARLYSWATSWLWVPLPVSRQNSRRFSHASHTPGRGSMFETTMPEHYCPCAWAFAYATSTLSKGGRKKKEKLYQIENLRCQINDKQGL